MTTFIRIENKSRVMSTLFFVFVLFLIFIRRAANPNYNPLVSISCRFVFRSFLSVTMIWEFFSFSFFLSSSYFPPDKCENNKNWEEKILINKQKKTEWGNSNACVSTISSFLEIKKCSPSEQEKRFRHFVLLYFHFFLSDLDVKWRE